MPDLFNQKTVTRYDYRFLLKEERVELLSTPRSRSCLAADPNPYWLTLFKGCGVGYTRDGHEEAWSTRLKKKADIGLSNWGSQMTRVHRAVFILDLKRPVRERRLLFLIRGSTSTLCRASDPVQHIWS